MADNRDDVRWSPRVKKWKLRRLYERVAEGIWDSDLIDDVGTTLWCRCRDILRIYRTKHERLVTCPRCDRGGTSTLIRREDDLDVPMVCPACGWSMTWRDYHRAFARRQLNPGGAVPYFQTFVDDYPSARTPIAKMLAIDLVIHAYHYSFKPLPDVPTRPAGVNLIDGKLGDIVPFLDELSGLNLPPRMQEVSRVWRRDFKALLWPAQVTLEDDPAEVDGEVG